MFAKEQEIVDKRYRVVDSIGKGAFGEIYLVEKKLTKVQYAMKAERYIKNASNPVLPKEAKIMKNLRNKGVDAIPTIHHFGQETASDGKTMMNIMIMDLLGKSI